MNTVDVGDVDAAFMPQSARSLPLFSGITITIDNAHDLAAVLSAIAWCGGTRVLVCSAVASCRAKASELRDHFPC